MAPTHRALCYNAKQAAFYQNAFGFETIAYKDLNGSKTTESLF
jgi:hypothetical protein